MYIKGNTFKGNVSKMHINKDSSRDVIIKHTEDLHGPT